MRRSKEVRLIEELGVSEGVVAVRLLDREGRIVASLLASERNRPGVLRAGADDAADAALSGRVPDEPLREGVVQVGKIAIEVLETPGHTDGSTCFALPGLVFTGDTLFPGGPGSTKDSVAFDTILDSIEARLFTQEANTLVLPGHGLDTTIGEERPHLEEWRVRGW